MTDMPLTHCHTCGRELPWNRIFVGDRAYCGDECMPAKTVGASTGPQTCHACGKAIGQTLWMTTEGCYCSRECLPAVQPDPRIAALEADLAEALGAIVKHLTRASGKRDGQVRFYDPELREAAYILARHGRFRVSYDAEFTEGEWVE